jgi:hypothetical protein
MFEDLIKRELPKTAHELHEIARKCQPKDCQGPRCKCGGGAYPWEWMHQMQRELHLLAYNDHNPPRNGTWHLKRFATPEDLDVIITGDR